MIIKFLVVALFICLGAIPVTANAILISVDWQSAGDNLVTQDSGASLEWLDLTVTTGLTGTYVLNNFPGWRYATLSEVNSLFEATGATGPYSGWSDMNRNLAMPLINLWGQTQEIIRGTETLWSSIAIYDLSANSGNIAAVQHATPGFNFLSSRGDWFNSADFSPSINLNLEFASPEYGHALVRNMAPVPEPSTMLLFSTALIGFSGLRIKRKKEQDAKVSLDNPTIFTWIRELMQQIM